jgi:hypothetical protein
MQFTWLRCPHICHTLFFTISSVTDILRNNRWILSPPGSMDPLFTPPQKHGSIPWGYSKMEGSRRTLPTETSLPGTKIEFRSSMVLLLDITSWCLLRGCSVSIKSITSFSVTYNSTLWFLMHILVSHQFLEILEQTKILLFLLSESWCFGGITSWPKE